MDFNGSIIFPAGDEPRSEKMISPSGIVKPPVAVRKLSASSASRPALQPGRDRAPVARTSLSYGSMRSTAIRSANRATRCRDLPRLSFSPSAILPEGGGCTTGQHPADALLLRISRARRLRRCRARLRPATPSLLGELRRAEDQADPLPCTISTETPHRRAAPAPHRERPRIPGATFSRLSPAPTLRRSLRALVTFFRARASEAAD